MQATAICYRQTAEININMRCIEMNIARAKAIEQEKININMRCIEIKVITEVIKECL